MELNISVNSASEADSKADSGETEQAAGKSNDLSVNGTSNQKGSAVQSPEGVNVLREEKIDTPEKIENTWEKVENTWEGIKNTPEKIENTPEKIENTREKIESTPDKIEHTWEKIGSTPEKIESTREKVESTREEIEHTWEKIGSTPERIGSTREKIENTWDKMGSTPEKIENTREKIESDGKVRIPAENEQFRKISSAAIILTQKTENPGGEDLLKEKKKLKALLNDFVVPDKIVISQTDEVIALNDEISFIFSDENTIKNHLICGGKQGATDRKRQRQQLRDTASRLDYYRGIIEPFISISRRDYFLLFLRVRTEIKFRGNKMNAPCKYVNLLLFALANKSFTYDVAPGKVRISKAYIAAMTAKLMKIKWIEKHHTRNSRYFCLTETALKSIKDTIGKKTSDPGGI